MVFLLDPSVWPPELYAALLFLLWSACPPVLIVISIDVYMYPAYLYLPYSSVVLPPIAMSCAVHSLDTAYTCAVRGRAFVFASMR